ncbi:MAG: acyl-CoA thioesterase [Gemmatimonadales bacterium]|nr:acyl-CoA thioesterase [Gemmatimonadales bacterium]
MNEEAAQVDPIPVLEIELPIRWGDMDAMGHVNNAVYFTYMEQLRIDWFGRLGFSPDPGGEGPVIVNAHCSFMHEMRYPGTVRARLLVGRIGRSTVETVTEMSRSDEPDRICARGGATVVWVNFPEKRSAPLPGWVREIVLKPLI